MKKTVYKRFFLFIYMLDNIKYLGRKRFESGRCYRRRRPCWDIYSDRNAEKRQ